MKYEYKTPAIKVVRILPTPLLADSEVIPTKKEDPVNEFDSMNIEYDIDTEE